MKNSKRFCSVFILFALAVIEVSAQAQPRINRVTDRQVSSIVQRLERSTNRFRGSLNLALVNGRIDQTRPQNDINSFEPAFSGAVDQYRDQFTRRQAGEADVQNILRKASLVNGFMSRNRLNLRVQNDWAAVRTDLNALASAYGLSWQWNQTLAPQSPNQLSGLSDSELNQLIRRIETGGDSFRSSLTAAFERNRNNKTQSEGNINVAVSNLKNATDQLRSQFNARQSVADYVPRVLDHAASIDTYMRDNRLTTQAQNDWSTLHRDLDKLGAAFNVATNWQDDTDQRRSQAGYNSDSRLTGTFTLDSSRSDKASEVAERVTRSLSDDQRQSVRDRMLARLESPEMLAIERHGSTMTMASSRAQQSTFEADGVERQEELNGRSSRVTATLTSDQLGVRSTGYRESDFTVSIEAIENGRRLRVRREIYSDRLNEPVIANSIYDRTSDTAQWNIYYGSASLPDNTGANSGEFLMRDGETVVAILNNDLSTKQAKQGDRFAATVRDGQYEGAVIEGTIGSVNQGGKLTGRSGMSFNFDTIQLTNGQTHRFAGILTNVRTLNGDSVKTDNEGSAQGDNQTTQTVTRAGIGTAVGAIIGAIAGGGKGAAIGGIIGAAGGAGSVYVTGKDNLELPKGTELTIRAGAPR